MAAMSLGLDNLTDRESATARFTAALDEATEPAVITVAAWKGGVGKTQLAYELAYLLGSVLVDWDWDKGGATRKWGYRVESRINAPLLDALERGRVPRPLTGLRKPDLVPSHPDLVDNQPTPDATADAIQAWAKEWRRYVVNDTHPGGVPTTYGAIAAADVVITPAVLATNELEAFEGMLEELPDYPLLVIPYKIPPVPPAPELERLERIVKRFPGIQVGPPVSRYPWVERRKIRVAMTSYDPVPARLVPVDEEFRAVAEAVKTYVRAAA